MECTGLLNYLSHFHYLVLLFLMKNRPPTLFAPLARSITVRLTTLH